MWLAHETSKNGSNVHLDLIGSIKIFQKNVNMKQDKNDT